MKSKKRLTAAQFEMIRPRLRMTENRIAAARGVMVDGLAAREAAEPYGWVRQNVTDAVNLIWTTFEDYQATKEAEEDEALLMPPGWARITLIAPVELIARFRAEIAQAAQQWPKRQSPDSQPIEGQPDDDAEL